MRILDIGAGFLNGFFTVWVPNKSSESTSITHKTASWHLVAGFPGGLVGYGSHWQQLCHQGS
jgi:hypothetical protein